MQTPVGSLGIIEELDVEIPMRDGTILRGNLWRPDAHGRFPALLVRTPYGKADGGYERYVRAGYAVMCQDTRGRYASDGVFTVFTQPTMDGEDGYDTIEWLAAQPWCNRRVGTMGASYLGWMQWSAARLRPPHLVAMCARSIPLELTDVDWPGVFRPGRRIHWWFNTIAPDLRRRAGWPPPHTPQEARTIWNEIEQGSRLGLLPWGCVADYLPPPLSEQVAGWLRHPSRRVWRFAEAHAEITVPNLDFTGWYDHCFSLGHFTGMRRNGGSALAREHTRVVCGPWSHVSIGSRETLGTDFGSSAAVDVTDVQIRWFDYWLKGIGNGVDEEPPMRYFVVGSGQWKSTGEWPPPGAEELVFFLAGAGDAHRPDGSGSLNPEPGSDAPTDACRYDPRDPVPTLWSRQMFAGPTDRSRLDYRRDILRYRTPPLPEDVEIAGRPEGVLYAATSARDTDFFVWMSDENPDGRAPHVASGVVRARHRRCIESEDLVTPGEVVEYRIRLSDIACRFRAGHRIRLDIASSDFPNFDRNHNTGRNDLFDTELRVAEQTVHHTREYPSRLILPRIR